MPSFLTMGASQFCSSTTCNIVCDDFHVVHPGNLSTLVTLSHLSVVSNSAIIDRAKLVQHHNSTLQDQTIRERSYRCEDFYHYIKTVGRGTFGNVYLAEEKACVNEHQVHRRVAIKRFVGASPAGMSPLQQKARAREVRSSFKNECELLSQLEHPNVIRLYESFDTSSSTGCEDPNPEDDMTLVLELCEGGELYDWITSHKHGIPERLAANFMRQSLLALQYLHSQNIVHRDIKTENFLFLTRLPDSNPILKLCDFGTAVRLTADQPRVMERIGTLSYAAPEVYQSLGADCMADMWSVGVVLYVMLCASSPFRQPNDTNPQQQTIRRVKAGAFDTTRPSWFKLSSQAKDLVKRLLVVESGKRLSAHEALQHPWITGFGEIPQHLSMANRLINPAVGTDLVASALEKYGSVCTSQRLFQLAVARLLSERDLPDLVEMFLLLDQDHDGKLSQEEWVIGFQRISAHIKREQRKHVELPDHLAVTSSRSRSKEPDAKKLEAGDILPGQKYLPVIGSSHVSPPALTVRDLRNIFKVIDLDGSGFVEYHEFVAAFLSDTQTLQAYVSPAIDAVALPAFRSIHQSADDVIPASALQRFVTDPIEQGRIKTDSSNVALPVSGSLPIPRLSHDDDGGSLTFEQFRSLVQPAVLSGRGTNLTSSTVLSSG